MKRPFFLLFFSSFLINLPSFAAMPPASVVSIPAMDREYAGNLESLSQKNDAKGDFFKLKQAEQYLRNHDGANALKLVSEVQDQVLIVWKQVLQAESYLALNQPNQVLVLLRQLPQRPDVEISLDETAYQDLYKRALLAKFQANKILGKDTHEEVAELLSLFPNQSDVNAILGSAAVSSLSALQKMDKVHVLAVTRQFKQMPGVMSASEIISSSASKDKKCQTLFELGSGLRQNKGFAADSEDALQGVLTLNCNNEYTPKAMYWIGVLTSTTPQRSKEVLTRLYQDYPNHRLADDAVYKLYKQAEKANDESLENHYFKKLLGLKAGDMRNTVIFEKAFPLYQKGEYKKAAELLEYIVDSAPTADESYPQGLYWYARALEKDGNKKHQAFAKQSYDKLLKDFPFSFYAGLASERLGKPTQIPNLPTLGGSAPSGGSDYFALIDDLNDSGFHDAASEVLDVALNLNPTWQKSHEEFVTKKLIESHHYRKALDLAAAHFDSSPYGLVVPSNDPMFAAFYPFAYKKQTQMCYNRCSLPHGAIEGIMREESLFQKNIKSWVGATGLMQLMPTTASMVARSIPDRSISLADLTDPESNIMLGSTYLQSMVDKFDGQIPLAIMAYNAGPGNVSKWLRLQGDLELDEFIEAIPFDETRGYVKRVMRSMLVYGDLYNEPYFQKSFFSFNIKK